MSRKVILGFGVSIDGYIARRNGAMDFLVLDKEGEALMADFFANIDTTIMGRKTAVGMLKMRKSGEMPETPGITNYVVSRRWKLSRQRPPVRVPSSPPFIPKGLGTVCGNHRGHRELTLSVEFARVNCFAAATLIPLTSRA